ncbi:YqeG family HAD IIIA-type phosphatase [Staphylococcus sp. HKU1]|uniref:YqeG family HAD IIIA-type phosphatase n=1 Tax=unclassified Staphylococcus TaxID=91994 RepID=UPI00203C5F95|nr:YqeG family HAD IIIA-type phosphatase [Staphylococcus sp. Marseille-Q6910]
MGIIKKKFLPNEYVQSVYQIDFNKLAEQGFKGIITDLDNTLVGWDELQPTESIKKWFKQADDLGITVTIVSNNHEKRVADFCEDLNVDYIFEARKPRGRAFNQAIQRMNLQPSDIVVIGDQMMTDIFGGNRRGLFTIMVVPIKKTDGFVTKFNRIVERRLLHHFKRKGYIKWEEN